MSDREYKVALSEYDINMIGYTFRQQAMSEAKAAEEIAFEELHEGKTYNDIKHGVMENSEKTIRYLLGLHDRLMEELKRGDCAAKLAAEQFLEASGDVRAYMRSIDEELKRAANERRPDLHIVK